MGEEGALGETSRRAAEPISNTQMLTAWHPVHAVAVCTVSGFDPVQRDLGVVLWPSGFLEAWGTEAKKPLIFRKLAGLGPWYPMPPQKDLANKNTTGSF